MTKVGKTRAEERARKGRYALPPVKCRAIVKRTGKQCRMWAIPGATVCRVHGGAAPQVQRKAPARVTAAVVQSAAQRVGGLADHLDEAPRPPWAVIMDGIHVTDSIARDLLEQVRAAGPNATPEQVDRMLAAFKASHSMSESAIRLGLVRLIAKASEHEVSSTRAVLLGVLDALLANLDASDAHQVRLWVIRAFQAGLGAAEAHPRRLVEHPSRPPERAERDVERLDRDVRNAASAVPWEDVGLVLVSRADRAELLRLRAREREGRAHPTAESSAPAPPFTSSVTSPRPGQPVRLPERASSDRLLPEPAEPVADEPVPAGPPMPADYWDMWSGSGTWHPETNPPPVWVPPAAPAEAVNQVYEPEPDNQVIESEPEAVETPTVVGRVVEPGAPWFGSSSAAYAAIMGGRRR